MIEPTMRRRNTIAWSFSGLIPAALLGMCLVPLAVPVAAQQVPVKPDVIRKQLSQAGAAPSASAGSQPRQAASAPAPKAAKPAASAAPARTAVPAPQTASRPAPKTPRTATAPAQKAPAAEKAPAAAPTPELKPVADHPSGPRRDPFEPLVGQEKAGPAPENLPPGKAGLQIATLRLDGIVRGPNGMIAVVTNPQQRVYFLRNGDRLYDGEVEQITMEGVSFHQSGTDPFGKPVEREVTKRLFPTPGEEK